MKEIMKQREQGYAAARNIETDMNHLLEKYPLEEYPWLWLTVARTISTGLSIIEEMAGEVLKDA